MEQIVNTIERLMRIYYRKFKGLQDLVGGRNKINRTM